MTAEQIAALAIKTYAEMRPRPTQVNQGQAAEILGISRGTVTALVRKGVLRINSCGLIPIESVDSARDARAS